MKLGILDALASPKVNHIKWHGSPAGTYIHFLDSVDAPFSYTVYEVSSGEFPASIGECDAYLISGSVNGAYDDEAWIGELMQFVRSCYGKGIKMVGICFGHQLLAHALGGKSDKSEKGWGLGLKTFDVAGIEPWMNGRPTQCALYFSHQDQVVELPPGARHLGGNAFCENAFFVMGEQVLGIQGHPEFTPAIMQDILTNPKEAIPTELQETAVRSLENGRPDNELVARWIVSFLTA